MLVASLMNFLQLSWPMYSQEHEILRWKQGGDKESYGKSQQQMPKLDQAVQSFMKCSKPFIS